MSEESPPRGVLAALAPELADLPLRAASMGAEKRVWFVGDAHVLRLARSGAVAARMAIERAVLDRIAGALAFPTPRVVAASPDGHADLCRKVPGSVLDWRAWIALSRPAKQALCAPMGRFLASLHDAVDATRARGLGVPARPQPAPMLLEGLRGRTADAHRELLLERVLEALEALPEETADVLLHGDFSHHNLAVDPASHALRGVFDFASAGVGDFHVDLRYDPAFELGGDAFLRAYQEARSVSVSPARQALLHAASALENLRYSLDHEGPELQAVRLSWVDAVAAWPPTRLRT